LDLPTSLVQFHTVGGGSINDTFRLIVNSQSSFFVKVNSAPKYPKLFQKEKRGLNSSTTKKSFVFPL